VTYRYDIYVVAVDIDSPHGLIGTMYGISCDGPIYFYGWTGCSDFTIPTSGWPGCGEGVAQSWSSPRFGENVVLGILDVYVYPGSNFIEVGEHPVGYAEFCSPDQIHPSSAPANCVQFTAGVDAARFGTVGFNDNWGYNPCGVVVGECDDPIVTVLTPNGGETWHAGDTEEITWTATDASGVDSISIYYELETFGSDYLIASGEANDGVYSWVVPDSITDNAKVLVIAYDPLCNTGFDQCDAVFAIADDTPPEVTVTQPNGGELWYPDAIENVTWTATDSNGIDSVNVYYSVDGGSNYTLIASDVENDGIHPWTIPFTPSDSALVTIVAYDSFMNVGSDTSDAMFAIVDTIPPAVAVLFPNGGDTLQIGAITNITWTATDSCGVDHVNIYYSETGSSYSLIASGEPNDGIYPWQVPGPPGSNFIKVEAVDGSGNGGEDVSDASSLRYDLIPPSVTVVAPNGGETWYMGDTQDITWTASDNIDIFSVDLYYSTNGGTDYTPIISLGPGQGERSYAWTIPDEPSDSVLVRAVVYDHYEINSAVDVSDSLFTIADDVPPAVTVTSPNGGETWYIGDTEDITWTATDSHGVDSVSIYYSTYGGSDWTRIASQEPNDGIFAWTVPDTITSMALVKVVAYDPSLNAGEDQSDALFDITDGTPPVVTVTAPNGGEVWNIATPHNITWTATDERGIDHVSLYYSVNGGADFTLIDASEPDDGVYPWTVPNAPTTTAMVRVVAFDPYSNSAADTSDAVFTIADATLPTVTVKTPDGGETWHIGTTEDITWSAYDAQGVDSVSISYSANGGGDWTQIASGEDDDGTYEWTIPNDPSTNALVKVTAYDPYVNEGEDVSNAVFTIETDVIDPVVVVYTPNDGDTVEVANPYEITWSATDAGGVDSVSIYYSINGGSSYTPLSTGGPNSGSYYWIAPPPTTSSLTVKVVAYDRSLNSGEDESDGLSVIVVTGPAADWSDLGGQADAGMGYCVSDAGDVNGDGYDDVIVGAPYYDNVGTNEGRAYVYHGSASGLSGTPDWQAEGDQDYCRFGYAVAGAGDVNGDGYDDVIVGAPYYDNGQNNEGRAYVYLGSASGLSGTPAWTAESDQDGALYGISVASAGNVNGDTYDEVLVGASQYSNGEDDEGRAFVYYGSSSGPSTTPDWTREPNQARAYYGVSVSCAGDVNGDNYDDVIVGANGYDNGENSEGIAYVYHGSASGLSGLYSWTFEPDMANAGFGICVSGAGDVDADGYDDVIVGAHGYTNGEFREGAAYLFEGSASGLGTTEAWLVEGGVANGGFGQSVSGVGDFNDDGYADVIVGAPYGEAFIYDGSSSGLSTGASWTQSGEQAGAYFGQSVSGAGDINNDGASDAIVGAYEYDHDEVDEGAAFVFYGTSSADLTPPVVTVLSPNGGELWYVCDTYDITWTATDENGVDSVAIYYSINGSSYAPIASGEANDGLFHWTVPDVVSTAALVKVVAYDPSENTGEDISDAVFEVADVPLAPWMKDGDQWYGYLGSSVAGAGDVNGDGYDDLIVGAYGWNNVETNEGRAYVYHGSSGGLTVASWFAEPDVAHADFGKSVACAGDVNNDGYDDVIVGAPKYDNPEGNEGGAFVYHGGASGLAATAAWSIESEQNSAYLGCSVSGAGDVNGDGYDDVIVGAYGYNGDLGDEGLAEVYYGSGGGLLTSPAWTVEGDQSTAELGWSVSDAGDVNGDGYGDVIVGVPSFSNGETDEGRAYVYYGSSSGLSVTPDWTTESDQADAKYGCSVACAGDVNRDGYDDVIVGASRYGNGESGEGRAYLYYGSASGLSTTAAWTDEGDQIDAEYGYSVACAGDLNGDLFDDVVVGARYYDNGETDEGMAFVYHGSFGGLSTAPDTTYESDQADAHMGWTVHGAGDVNGDGYGHLAVGAPKMDNCETDEGCAFVFEGDPGTVDVPEPPVRSYAGRLDIRPNPFKATSGTNICYSVERAGKAEIVIFDAHGRLVATMEHRAIRGDNRVVWDGRASDGSGIPSGVYFCQVKAGDFVSRRKMMLVQ
jgi:hypothetical protein